MGSAPAPTSSSRDAGAALTTIAGLIDKGEVAVEVEEVFPLAEAARAHRQGEDGHTRGKLVLRVGA
ncbi:hypothetical protein SANTM175S_05177 [Streptomyces antimycoticus]